MLQDILWVEKYRPSKIDDVILPNELKQSFKKFVDNKEIPNLILTGNSGVGKTTVAKALLEELGCSYLVINGSMDRNIDTLRSEILNFASSISLRGGRKYIILDEADYLNASSTQPALRNFMEEFSANCGFILTCNFLNRIIQPLHSRCSVIKFNIQKSEKAGLAKEFFLRVKKILTQENVEFDDKVVADLILKYFPDYRRILNELQRYSAVGRIDSGILSMKDHSNIDVLVSSLRDRNFSQMRSWVAENLDRDHVALFRKLFDSLNDILEPNSIPQMILHLSKYQYQASFVADQEINTVAFLTEVMADCQFK